MLKKSDKVIKKATRTARVVFTQKTISGTFRANGLNSSFAFFIGKSGPSESGSPSGLIKPIKRFSIKIANPYDTIYQPPR